MDFNECGMRNAECGLRRVPTFCLAIVSLLLVVAAIGCDNDELTEETALHVFGGASKEEPAEDTYSPAEDTYSPPEDTWTDPTSGLTWQVEPTGGTMNWSDAKAHCVGLSLGGGGWHLPTIGELRTLIRGCPGTVTGGACGVTDDCLDSSCNDDGGCYDCSSSGGPADGCYWPDGIQGTCSWYWSSSAVADVDNYAWSVYFDGVVVGYAGVYTGIRVRCVR